VLTADTLSALKSDPGSLQNLINALQSDQRAAAASTTGTQFPNSVNPIKTDTPVSVSAPPVSSPPTVTKVQTIPNADGTTSTQTTTQTTTVSPQVTGSTVSTTTINYPSTTTTNVTTVNNTTNVTTVNNTTTNNQSPPVQPYTPPSTGTSGGTGTSQALPTDYNRENTQQQILKAVDGTGVPDGSTIDKDSALTSIDSQNTATSTAVNNTSAASIGVFNWFPQIPTATCQDPSVANPITGALLDVPICQPVNIFGKFISAVICFFALVGSVREVQSALKA
jgi:hypothetical protein